MCGSLEIKSGFMLSELTDHKHVTGVRQTVKAIAAGKAQKVFLAEDADEFVRQSVLSAAETAKVAVEQVKTMKGLGRACGIQVQTASAAIIIQSGAK